ncbi:SHOCT domain-containing protein [Halobellus rubicundus]|uniref:SHOCT domain-containing protein n=1 Tax=Halobellus rubicundus TaxID=2996466 RepID=A0ABD5MBB9_9EURY
MTQQYSTRWLVGGVVALAALVFLAPLLVGGGAMGWGGMGAGMTGGMGSGTWGPMHGGWMMDGATAGAGGWWWLLLAALWRLLVLAALVGGGYLLYRAVVGDGVGDVDGTGADPAIRELRTAYARGDLSDEEYERRRERLENE